VIPEPSATSFSLTPLGGEELVLHECRQAWNIGASCWMLAQCGSGRPLEWPQALRGEQVLERRRWRSSGSWIFAVTVVSLVKTRSLSRVSARLSSESLRRQVVIHHLSCLGLVLQNSPRALPRAGGLAQMRARPDSRYAALRRCCFFQSRNYA
jgi:hypothetical protein